MPYKSVLFGVVVGATAALLGTTKVQADSVTFNSFPSVTEGGSGFITGTYANSATTPVLVTITAAVESAPTGDTTDSITLEPIPVLPCGPMASCPFFIPFTTDADVGETDADSGTTPVFVTLVVSGVSGSLGGGVDVTVNDAVPGPIVGTGVPGLIFASGGLLAWWRRKRKAQAVA